MSHYISSSDLTDKVIRDFFTNTTPDSRCDTWLTRVDKEIDYIGETFDVPPTSFSWCGSTNTNSALMHPKIMEYARAYLGLIVAEDNIGANSMNPAQDELYITKMKQFQEKINDLRSQITKYMFVWGDKQLLAEQVVGQTGTMWRA